MARIAVSVGILDGMEPGKVADAAREAGLRVHQVMDLIGVVTGDIDADDIPRLQAVPGVGSVERQRDDVGIRGH